MYELKENIIYIDSSEKTNRIREMFARQDKFPVEIIHLELADLVFDSIAVERKGASDFLSSYRRSQFWLNLQSMKECFNNYYLWLDGSEEEFYRAFARAYKNSWESYRGALAKIYEMNIPIIRTTTLEDAIDLFMRLFVNASKSGEKNRIPLEIKKRHLSSRNRRIQSIATIATIGTVTAESLLDQFTTIERLIAAAKSNKDKNKTLEKIKHHFCTADE